MENKNIFRKNKFLVSIKYIFVLLLYKKDANSKNLKKQYIGYNTNGMHKIDAVIWLVCMYVWFFLNVFVYLKLNQYVSQLKKISKSKKKKQKLKWKYEYIYHFITHICFICFYKRYINLQENIGNAYLKQYLNGVVFAMGVIHTHITFIHREKKQIKVIVRIFYGIMKNSQWQHICTIWIKEKLYS